MDTGVPYNLIFLYFELRLKLERIIQFSNKRC